MVENHGFDCIDIAHASERESPLSGKLDFQRERLILAESRLTAALLIP